MYALIITLLKLPMKFPTVFLATAVALVWADGAIAKSAAEVESIARATVVEIKLQKSPSVGSGVMIQRQGDLYTLVTNRHVVCGRGLCSKPNSSEKYTLTTGDGQKRQVSATAVKMLGKDLDLAIIQFRSSQAYPVAKFATKNLNIQDPVYTAGYPLERPGFAFGSGKAIAIGQKRLREDGGGYTIIYNAATLPGMSGGGVFDGNGELVAIHGQGDRYRPNTELNDKLKASSKIGYNRGIPVSWLLRELPASGGKPAVISPGSNNSTADDHFIAGFNLFVEPGDDFKKGKQEAINEFTQAIRLRPKYLYAYFARAYVYDQLEQYTKAIEDYNQVVAIDPQYTEAYLNRGAIKYQQLGDIQGALADYNRAIETDTTDASAYFNRAALKERELNDFQGALVDYNKAIQLDPKFVHGYNNRGYLKYSQLNDLPGALADYNQAIAVSPEFADAYVNRSVLKADRLNDAQGALDDVNRAIELRPNNAVAWNNRGLIQASLFDKYPAALNDYNKSIQIDPKYAIAYLNRGNLKKNILNDYPGALADYNRCIELDPKSPKAYSARGKLKGEQLQDYPGAVADFDRAIALNPRSSDLYYNRGLIQAGRLGDFDRALANFDKAIETDPQSAQAYWARGLIRYTIKNERTAAIADVRQAAKLARAQGNKKVLQAALGTLAEWKVSE
jgi:tetratricopeptide (TPR) repeat protein